jgi:hypothetical protein
VFATIGEPIVSHLSEQARAAGCAVGVFGTIDIGIA